MENNTCGKGLPVVQNAKTFLTKSIELGLKQNSRSASVVARSGRMAATVALTVLCLLLCSPLANVAHAAATPQTSTPASQMEVCKDVKLSDTAQASRTAETTAILAPICGYFAALNHSDLAAVLKVYSDDPVMLPFLLPTVVGREAVQHNYENTFQHVRFQMHTTIQEVVHMSPEWAFVRNDSAGFFTPTATGKSAPSTFHELFVVRKGTDGTWRIARYSFSPTAPLPVF